MPTNAHYFSSLAPNPSNDSSYTLIFDYLGHINFYSLNVLQQINYQGVNQPINDITNACILYAIAQKVDKEVGAADFCTWEAVKDVLMANMNAAIMNREEVALEIFTSWQAFSQIVNTKGKPETDKNRLQPIPNFPKQINSIIGTLLNEPLKKINSKQAINPKDLIPLSLTLECITRNMAGAPFCLLLSEKNILFKLSRQMDAFLVSKLEEIQASSLSLQEKLQKKGEIQTSFLPLQEKLQKDLVSQTGIWLTSLINFFDYELKGSTITTFKSKIAELSKAINNLLSDEFSTLTGDDVIKQYIENLTRTMQLERMIVNSFIKRDNEIPNQLIFQQATHFALRKAALNYDIALDPKVIFKFKPSYYDYNYFNLALGQLTNTIGITKHCINIFGYVLAQLAEINQFPTFCKIYENKTTHPNHLVSPTTHLFIELDLTLDNLIALVDNLNTRYGDKTASIAQSENPFQNPRIKVDLPTLIEQILPDWHVCLINTLLAKNRIKEAYQNLSYYQNISLDYLLLLFQSQCTPLKKPFTPFIFVEILLTAFNIEEKPTYTHFFQSENRMDALFDIDIYLNISTAAANRLVSRINTAFPQAYATLQHTDIDNGSKIISQHISLDKQLFLDIEFQKHLSNTIRLEAKRAIQATSLKKVSNTLYSFHSPSIPAEEPKNADEPSNSNCCIIS
ncbi:Uncharacterised protein [Legionella beliardensis]|uniref:Uncharacterized protein n=1 Tax=Legionella beliardensis TaxID=91822 RepID=A0A378I023_9GAMM|nr:hypothetical protein [Legionella beliardensis]STX28101.1 Uncharacterised protein [Legionella beliardensis]